MIHVATVHWQSDRWVDVQLRHLRRHLREPYRTYAFLDGLPREHAAKFDHAACEGIESHATKLDRLAATIRSVARDDDLLVFLDGDAFPIGDVVGFARERLPRHRLIAVQRRENDGDPQPHPCFCITTVGFWQEIEGSWQAGLPWNGRGGEPVTDVGGRLLEALEARGIDWLPLLRSNQRDLHPLWCGVYGDLVYHHGAGFRRGRAAPAEGRFTRPLSRADRAAVLGALTPIERLLCRLPALRERIVGRRMAGAAERNRRLLDAMYQRIRADDEFHRELLEPRDPG